MMMMMMMMIMMMMMMMMMMMIDFWLIFHGFFKHFTPGRLRAVCGATGVSGPYTTEAQRAAGI